MTLALADVNTGRLLRTLSLAGPTSATAPSSWRYRSSRSATCWPTPQLSVSCDGDGNARYRVEPVVAAALVRQNRAKLLGAVA